MHQKVGRVLEVRSALPQRVSRDALIRAGRGVDGSGLIARCVERLLEDAAQYPAGKQAGWNGCGWGGGGGGGGGEVAVLRQGSCKGGPTRLNYDAWIALATLEERIRR